MKPLIKSYKSGTHLFYENDHSRELYIIQSGNIKVYRINDGREIVLTVLGKGAVLGEMALIDGKPRSASAKAIDDCVVASIDAKSFFEKTTGVPGWFMTIIRLASRKIRATNLRLKAVRCEHEEANIVIAFYYMFKKFNSSGTVAISSMHDNLIKLLGVTSYQISSVIKFLEKNNFLKITTDRFSIIDIQRLGEYAEFLRLLIRKKLSKVKSFSPEINRLLIAVAADYPEIVKYDEPSTSLSGDELWVLFFKAGLKDSYSTVLIHLRESNLLTCTRNDIKEDGLHKNPFNGYQFKINNRNWKRVCLFAKFNQYMLIA